MFKGKVISVFFLLFLLPCSLLADQWVTGYVEDAESGEPLEYAQVAVMTQDTNMVNGDVTDENGYFEVQGIEKGEYLFRVSFVGYGQQWSAIEVGEENLDVGTLYLASGDQILDEIQIDAAPKVFRSEGDRRIYDVEQMSVAEGGSAIDILETIPSVQIDQEGDISMRGSGNISIHINGRPTNLSSDEMESVLDQYPTHAIQDIELITNPSARYDAEGSGGIINLVLNEEMREGFRGQADVSAGTGHKYSGGTNLNYRRDRINVFTNYSYQYRERWVGNITDRENKRPGTSPLLYQDHSSDYDEQTHLLRSGLEYDFSAAHQARVFGSFNIRDRDRYREFDIENKQRSGELDSQIVRDVDEEHNRVNWEAGTEFTWDPVDDDDQQLYAALSYSVEDQDQFERFDRRFFDSHRNLLENRRQRHIFDRPSENRQIIGEVDYEGRYNERTEFETGLRSTISREEQTQIFEEFDFEEEEYGRNEDVTGLFEYDEDVHAAYLSISRDRGAFNYQAGLRGEYTMTEPRLPERDSTHSDNYFNIFPSAHLNYDIGDRRDLQVSYSRRINRPHTGSLNPLLNVQDEFNLRQGNMSLEPEFNNNYEVSYIRGWEDFSVTSSIFHRTTQNSLTRVLATHDERRSTTTWDNAETRNATGAEVIKYYEPNNNFDARLTSEVYHSLIEGEDQEQEYSNQSYTYAFSLMSNIRIPDWVDVQVNANYRGERVIPQGHIEPRFYLDLGLRRNVFDGQGTLSLSFDDVFDSRQFELQTENESFKQFRSFERETQVATLSFTYRFSDGSEEF